MSEVTSPVSGEPAAAGGAVTEGPAPPRRRRRPTGEPPPLPRSLEASGWAWLMVAVVAVAAVVAFALSELLAAAVTAADLAVLRAVAEVRNGPTTAVLRAVAALGGILSIAVLRWAVVGTLFAARRWRHLLITLASWLVVATLTAAMATATRRPRPLGIEILTDWEGWAGAARPVATVAATLVAAVFALLPHGRPRELGKRAAAAVLAVYVFSRLYLGVDHPTDVVLGLVVGVTVPLVLFRLFAPNDVYPVEYRGGRQSAHLRIDDRRREAIETALHEQLGVRVLRIRPFGLSSSAGSTPLRITIADARSDRPGPSPGDRSGPGPERRDSPHPGAGPGHPGGAGTRDLFGKLYAASHLRADRWYKLGRTLLYGRLEDEGRFQTVRRLVQYEDYMLAVMHQAGLPVAQPYGFVEITPGREYLTVTDFIEGGHEIGEAEVDDEVIDDALQIMRRMWDAGFAHRDIKPANLLVVDRPDAAAPDPDRPAQVSGGHASDRMPSPQPPQPAPGEHPEPVFSPVAGEVEPLHGRVRLIDVAFGQVRPSPWRQAVDLANLMLVLALRTDAPRVYRRALQYFTPDEIAEAFAASRGVTLPSQSRRMLKEDQRDLLAEFRRLAPPRPPIAVQRWSWRRIGLLAATLFGAYVTVALVLGNLDTLGMWPR